MADLLKIAAALLITGLNAFFVVSEYALVSMRPARLEVRPARLEEMIAAGNSTAELVLKMTQKRDTYLSAIQLGITASSLILGWFCGPLLAGLMADWFDLIGEHWYDDGVVVLCTFLLIVFVHVVFGELVPRVISLGHVERAAMAIAYPLIFFDFLPLSDVPAGNLFQRSIARGAEAFENGQGAGGGYQPQRGRTAHDCKRQ